jgi:hypothetical protein
MPGVGGCSGWPEEVPLQEQADEPGRQRDRPVGVVVRLGQVPPHQRGDQTTPAAGPRRLPAFVRGGDRRQA